MISTSSFTSLLGLGSDIAELDLPAQASSSPTLAAALLPGSQVLVQVTGTAVTVWSDLSTGVSNGTWTVPSEITAGHVHGELAVVATRGGQVAVLSLAPGPELML